MAYIKREAGSAGGRNRTNFLKMKKKRQHAKSKRNTYFPLSTIRYSKVKLQQNVLPEYDRTQSAKRFGRLSIGQPTLFRSTKQAPTSSSNKNKHVVLYPGIFHPQMEVKRNRCVFERKIRTKLNQYAQRNYR